MEKNPIWPWVEWHFWGRNELFVPSRSTVRTILQILKYILWMVRDGSTFRLNNFYIYCFNLAVRLFEKIHCDFDKICHSSWNVSEGQKWVSLIFQKHMVWRWNTWIWIWACYSNISIVSAIEEEADKSIIAHLLKLS